MAEAGRCCKSCSGGSPDARALQPAAMTAEWDGAGLVLTPDVPGVAALGQAAVLYQRARVIAGGFIRAG
jgi:hypothetical protein